MKSIRTALGAGILLLALSGCAADTTAPGGSTDPAVSGPAPAGQGIDAPVYDGEWILVSAERDGESVDLGDKPVTLVVDGAQVGGASFCNSYFGELVGVAGTFEVDGVGSTLMACVDERLMELETWYLGAIDSIDAQDLAGEQLTLSSSASNAVLEFERGTVEDGTDEAQD